MSVKEAITRHLTEGLRPSALAVIDESHQHAGHAGARPGGETHFRVQVTAEAFAGMSRVARHRMINDLLAAELRERVHALAIEARSPAEEPG